MAIPEYPGGLSRRKRRLWLAGIALYALAAAGDMAYHLFDHRFERDGSPDPGDYAVAFAAGLFWPVDIVAQLLLRLDGG